MASAHDRSRADDDDDPVETMIKKTGCLEHHYKVQVITFYTNPSKSSALATDFERIRFVNRFYY